MLKQNTMSNCATGRTHLWWWVIETVKWCHQQTVCRNLHGTGWMSRTSCLTLGGAKTFPDDELSVGFVGILMHFNDELAVQIISSGVAGTLRHRTPWIYATLIFCYQQMRGLTETYWKLGCCCFYLWKVSNGGQIDLVSSHHDVCSRPNDDNPLSVD